MPLGDDASARQAQLFVTLQLLLAIDAVELRPALEQASRLIAEPLVADAVDVFLYDPPTDSLVAVAWSDATIGPRQQATGLDRLPLTGGGPTVEVFRSGRSLITGQADREPGARPELTKTLAILSVIMCPLRANRSISGVLRAVSRSPDRFSQADLGFLESVARWVGLIARRAELVEEIAQKAVEEGRRQIADEIRRLTHREQEVAILVASGLTNEAIADRLVLVPGTVSNHVEHILRKLGFTRRVQIATWTVQHGLWSPDSAAPE